MYNAPKFLTWAHPGFKEIRKRNYPNKSWIIRIQNGLSSAKFPSLVFLNHQAFWCWWEFVYKAGWDGAGGGDGGVWSFQPLPAGVTGGSSWGLDPGQSLKPS